MLLCGQFENMQSKCEHIFDARKQPQSAPVKTQHQSQTGVTVTIPSGRLNLVFALFVLKQIQPSFRRSIEGKSASTAFIYYQQHPCLSSLSRTFKLRTEQQKTFKRSKSLTRYLVLCIELKFTESTPFLVLLHLLSKLTTLGP